MNTQLRVRLLVAIAIAGVLSGVGVAAPAYATDPNVVPIDFSALPVIPSDSMSVSARVILRNSNKYAVTTWWNTAKNYAAQSGSTYLNLGGGGEDNIRPPAAEAMGLATSIRLGIYDPVQTGVSTATATAMTKKLIDSIAHSHFSNAGGWGTSAHPSSISGGTGWQTALWASQAGNAAWIFWDYLNVTERAEVRNMVEAEANRMIGWTLPYYRDLSGTVQFPGDSKAEELAWDANILQLATAMMPNHANYSTWMQKRLELVLAANARLNDLSPAKRNLVVNGKTLAQWLNGTNVYDDGTVVNHNRVHPAYMLYPLISAQGVLDQSLAGKATPAADIRGFAPVYDALVDLNWVPGPAPAEYASDPNVPTTVNAPGGPIYSGTSTVAGDPSDIYYPMANDWGFGSRMDFAYLDMIGTTVTTNGSTLDAFASQGGAYWAPIHLAKQLNMQARFADGHTYASGENTYYGREEAIADYAARACLLRLLWANTKITTTYAAF